MKKHTDYADMVLQAAEVRGDAQIPKEFVSRVLQQIDAGEFPHIERYPAGSPSLLAVYNLACNFYNNPAEQQDA